MISSIVLMLTTIVLFISVADLVRKGEERKWEGEYTTESAYGLYTKVHITEGLIHLSICEPSKHREELVLKLDVSEEEKEAIVVKGYRRVVLSFNKKEKSFILDVYGLDVITANKKEI